MLKKRYMAALVCSAMLLTTGCDEDPNAETDVKVLAERSFKIADTMIDEAERVDEYDSPE